MTDRIVVLVDMDCFYVQVEERDHPYIKGVPAAVVQYNSWRGGGIIAVNYEARGQGVKRSMRGDEAKSKCSDIKLIQVPVNRGKADLTKYRNAGKEVLQVLSDFTGRIERASIDEAYLDLTEEVATRLEKHNTWHIQTQDLPSTWVVGAGDINGTREDGVQEWLSSLNENDIEEKLYLPTPEHPQWDAIRLSCAAVICEEMRKAVLERTGFKCSAGIAHNKMLAKLTCGLHKPNQQTILPQQSVAGLWASMPIGKVRNLGGKLGDKVTEDLGCNTMADLAALTLTQLRATFDDKTALWLHNMGQGIDHELVTSRQLPKSIGCGKNFMGRESLNTREKVQTWMRSLADELAERLEADQTTNKRRARTLTVSLRLDGDDRWTSLSRTCPLPSYTPDRITRVALNLIQHTNQTTLKDPAWKPSIHNISLSASKFEDWDGAGSSNIKALFKKVALNNSLIAQKSGSHSPEEGSSLSPHKTEQSHQGKTLELTRAVEDKDGVSSEKNLSMRSLNKSDNIFPAVCIQKNKVEEQSKSPSNSFFKNFILKRKREAEEKSHVEINEKVEDKNYAMNSKSSRDHMDMGSGDSEEEKQEEEEEEEEEKEEETEKEEEEDEDSNLSLLLTCIENEETDLEQNKKPSGNEKPTAVKTNTSTYVSQSPDLFSSGESTEAKPESLSGRNAEETTSHSIHTSLREEKPNECLSERVTVTRDILCAEKVDKDSLSERNTNKRLSHFFPESSIAVQNCSPENMSESCLVSADELFPNLDDFDVSLLPLLPEDLRKMVEVKLAEHNKCVNKMNEIDKTSEKHGNIEKYTIQKSPTKKITVVPIENTVSIPGTSKENTSENEKCKTSNKKETDRNILSKDKLEGSKSEFNQEIQEHRGNEEINEGGNKSKGVVMGESINDENDDMVKCEECGNKVSAFELPEHLDYHLAVQLQNNLRRESVSVKVRADLKKGKKRPRSGKGDSNKIQRIDTFFTK